MKRIILIGLFSSIAGWGEAQTALPDSIQTFLRHTPKDSAFIVALNKLAFSALKSAPEVGREVASQSMKFSKEINFVRGYARGLDITGSSYWVTGDYEAALNYYQLSARESAAVKDSVGLSSVYHNMGEVYKKVGDFQKSIEFLTLSLQWDKVSNNHTSITLYNIGEAHLMMGELREASSYFNDALVKSIAEKDNRALAYCYHGLGSVKAAKKEYYPALAYFTQAEKIWKAQGELRSLIQTYEDFADVYLALGKQDQAEYYLNAGINIAEQIHAPDLQIMNYLNLSRLYAIQGNFRKAYEIMGKHNALKDSVYNVKKTENIARLQALFDTESRDRENNQLKAEKQLQVSQIKSQQLLIAAISIGLLVTGILAWVLYRQHRRNLEVNDILRDKNREIHDKKVEIEQQAKALKALNQQLQDLNKSLESRIEERTLQLIRQNEKLAAYAHANAHQLRAPVVSILGLLSLIDRLKLPQEDHDLVIHLIACGKQLDAITREISRNLEEEELLLHKKPQEVTL